MNPVMTFRKIHTIGEEACRFFDEPRTRAEIDAALEEYAFTINEWETRAAAQAYEAGIMEGAEDWLFVRPNTHRELYAAIAERAGWIDRVQRAGEVLLDYQVTSGAGEEDALSDLLCDLMHLAHARGKATFNEELRRAFRNFAETEGGTR